MFTIYNLNDIFEEVVEDVKGPLVYFIINKTTKRTYVGTTKESINIRFVTSWTSYLNYLGGVGNQLLEDIDKNWGNFKVIIKPVSSIERMYYLEKYYITLLDTFKNGYNKTPDGRGVISNSKSQKYLLDKLYEKKFIYLKWCENYLIEHNLIFNEVNYLISKAKVTGTFKLKGTILLPYRRVESEFLDKISPEYLACKTSTDVMLLKFNKEGSILDNSVKLLNMTSDFSEYIKTRDKLKENIKLLPYEDIEDFHSELIPKCHSDYIEYLKSGLQYEISFQKYKDTYL